MTGVREGTATALPEFTVRVSSRARHARLVMTLDGELVVVIPRRFDRRTIPAILEAKRRWIERARARVAARHPAEGPAASATPALPDRIALPAVGEEWDVEYRPPAPAGRSGNPSALRARGARAGSARGLPGGSLVVTAGDKEAAHRALIEWLRRRARTHLVGRLEQLSHLHGLPFERASVRHQRTRWASCSPKGAISLNLRLLFLEPALVDHVLIHELCHTKELNHSKRFWALLAAHDPDSRVHRKQVRETWRTLPAWVRPSRPARLV